MTMVNLKTKGDKHALDNEKRQKSIREREKAKLNQSLIIKQALSNSNLNSSKSKKIILNDDDDDDEDDNVGNNSSHQEVKNGKEKTVLFDGSGSEDENFEIKEKSQFSGKKGFELLNLQSTYGNDERFKIDERFLEDEKDDVEPCSEKGNHVIGDDEKDRELKILESVLGQPVKNPESEKKPKKRTYEMVRYDASNKEHEKYVIKSEAETKEPSKKRKKEKKSQKTVTETVPKPQVSKEKFYQVSSEIKSSFKEKKEDGGGGSFSILQTYSQNDTNAFKSDEEEEVEQVSKEFEQFEEAEDEEMDEENEEVQEQYQVEKTQEKMQENDVKMEEKPTVTKATVAQGIWKESFFFASDDPRFNEGLEFINKKDSKEAAEVAENYDQTRRKLREILRLHVKKQQKKKDPFRHKVGGMNKKQLANSKSKNNKTNFSKRKTPKMNPNGKI